MQQTASMAQDPRGLPNSEQTRRVHSSRAGITAPSLVLRLRHIDPPRHLVSVQGSSRDTSIHGAELEDGVLSNPGSCSTQRDVHDEGREVLPREIGRLPDRLGLIDAVPATCSARPPVACSIPSRAKCAHREEKTTVLERMPPPVVK